MKRTSVVLRGMVLVSVTSSVSLLPHAVVEDLSAHLFPGSCCGLSDKRFAVLKAWMAASSGPGAARDEVSRSGNRASAAAVDSHRRATRGVNCHGERCLQTNRVNRELSRRVAMASRSTETQPNTSVRVSRDARNFNLELLSSARATCGWCSF